MNCWAILQLEPTQNIRDIKRAYATLIKKVDLENDPESFQRLNHAYKTALEDARLNALDVSMSDSPIGEHSRDNELSENQSTQAIENPDNESEFIKPNNSNDVQTSIENEKALDKEIDKVHQPQQTQQDNTSLNESEVQCRAFYEHLRKLLQTPSLRESESAWQVFLDYPDFASFEFRENTSITVFAAFSDHFTEASVNVDGSFIPQAILQEIADRYAWDSCELELSNYFAPAEISRVLSYAYSNQKTMNSPETAEKTVNLGKLFLVMIVVIVLLALIFNGFINSNKTSLDTKSEEEVTQVIWDKRLLSCNKVLNAEPNDDFNLCLAQAKAGNINALKRIVWAYSQAGDYLNWQEVFDGLKILSKKDREAQLLLFTLMKFVSRDAKLERQGETGIQRLAIRNFAPANILLATLYALNENSLDQTSNVLWLLERAYENDPRSIAPIDLAVIYANGFVSKKDILKATSLLSSVAETHYPVGTNNVAWFLATLDENPFAGPELALSFAQKVVEHPTYGKRHTYVDTLAATFAAAGDFAMAVKTQQQAIDLIQALNWKQASKDREKANFEERLTLYKAEQTLVEFKLMVEKKPFFTKLRENLVNRLFNKLHVTIVEPSIPEVALPDNTNTENAESEILPPETTQ